MIYTIGSLMAMVKYLIHGVYDTGAVKLRPQWTTNWLYIYHCFSLHGLHEVLTDRPHPRDDPHRPPDHRQSPHTR